VVFEKETIRLNKERKTRIVRPHLKQDELELIVIALQAYVSKWEAKIEKHEDDRNRFKEDYDWLGMNELFNHRLSETKRLHRRMLLNLDGLSNTVARETTALKRLFNVDYRAKIGAYIPAIEAMKLLPCNNNEDAFKLLKTATDRGFVSSCLKGGILHVRKQDFMRWAAYVEQHQ